MAALAVAGLVVVQQEAPEVPAAVPGTGQHVEHHLVGDFERGREWLGRPGDQPVERLHVPVGVAPFRRLLPHQLFPLGGVGNRLGLSPPVFDPVHRCLDPHVALVVEAPSPGPPGDLGEFPVTEQPGRHPVVLAELREQHGPDGHVHPHPEGVGAADQLQEAGLGQLLDQESVAGEHPGVVQADPVADEPLQVLADRCVEPEPAHPLANGRLLLLGEHVEAA